MQTYRINISTANCNYDIAINGFPVFTETKGYQTNTHYNINQLVTGNNIRLQMNISPIEGETVLDENVQFELSANFYESDPENRTELFSYKYDNNLKLPRISDTKLIPVSKIDFVPLWHQGGSIDLKTHSPELIKQ